MNPLFEVVVELHLKLFLVEFENFLEDKLVVVVVVEKNCFETN